MDPVHDGYEVQIQDAADPWHRTGAIYSLAKAAPVPEKPQAEWRTTVITLDGERITVEVDGQHLSSFDAGAADNPPRKNWFEPIRELKRPTRGYLGLQNHDPGDVVWFKEVSVRPLAVRTTSATLGTTALVASPAGPKISWATPLRKRWCCPRNRSRGIEDMPL